MFNWQVIFNRIVSFSEKYNKIENNIIYKYIKQKLIFWKNFFSLHSFHKNLKTYQKWLKLSNLYITTSSVTSWDESLSMLGTNRIVSNVVTHAMLVARELSLQGAIRLNHNLLVVGRTTQKSVRDHSYDRYSAHHHVPCGQIPSLRFVFGDNQTRKKNSKCTED